VTNRQRQSTKVSAIPDPGYSRPRSQAVAGHMHTSTLGHCTG